jgi:hypothetical protein
MLNKNTRTFGKRVLTLLCAVSMLFCVVTETGLLTTTVEATPLASPASFNNVWNNATIRLTGNSFRISGTYNWGVDFLDITVRDLTHNVVIHTNVNVHSAHNGNWSHNITNLEAGRRYRVAIRTRGRNNSIEWAQVELNTAASVASITFNTPRTGFQYVPGDTIWVDATANGNNIRNTRFFLKDSQGVTHWDSGNIRSWSTSQNMILSIPVSTNMRGRVPVVGYRTFTLTANSYDVNWNVVAVSSVSFWVFNNSWINLVTFG